MSAARREANALQIPWPNRGREPFQGPDCENMSWVLGSFSTSFKQDVVNHGCPRSRWLGNPKLYACWLDESLNIVLGDVAKFSHRRTFEFRVFFMLALHD
eukprot:9479989-Pyramimonas_sp.AAC.1